MIQLIVTIGLVGFVAWLVTTVIPMPAVFKKAILALCAVGLLLYLLSYFGLWGGFDWPRHRLR